MPKVEEIVSSIESLPKEEFGRLRDWFYERDWEKWDRQIEEDSESGKLDFLVKEALDEKAAGTLKELYMHKTTLRLWEYFEKLPEAVKKTAKRNFDLLKIDPLYPSLHFKKVKNLWSIRIGLNHRALSIKDGQDFIWIWIGSHSDYDRMIREMG